MGITAKGVKNYRTRVNNEQAILLTHENLEDAANWCGGMVVREPQASGLTDDHMYVEYPTLYGTDHADIGYYIVKGQSGRFRKVPSATYDAIMEEVTTRDQGPVFARRDF